MRFRPSRRRRRRIDASVSLEAPLARLIPDSCSIPGRELEKNVALKHYFTSRCVPSRRRSGHSSSSVLASASRLSQCACTRDAARTSTCSRNCDFIPRITDTGIVIRGDRGWSERSRAMQPLLKLPFVCSRNRNCLKASTAARLSCSTCRICIT